MSNYTNHPPASYRPKLERNDEMYEARRMGASYEKLGRAFGISATRARTIVLRYEQGNRAEPPQCAAIVEPIFTPTQHRPRRRCWRNATHGHYCWQHAAALRREGAG